MPAQRFTVRTHSLRQGVGRLLIVAYGILALAALGRSVFQIVSKFDTAPLAYVLSAVAAVVYVVITTTLLVDRAWARRLTWVALAFEVTGVLAVGTVSVLDATLFPHDTVWSMYGRGYLFIPLVLPLLTMWWLYRHRTRATVVTIGKFDGLHVGHMELIREAVEIAQEERLQSVVVTFDRHPHEVVNPNDAPVALAYSAARDAQLAAAGIDRVEELIFDEQLADLTPEQFIDQVLVAAFHARVIVVGTDFRFGRHASGDLETLRALASARGIRIVVAEDVIIEGRRVSSTWVRECLELGDIRLATRLLGHPPVVVGEVVHGLKRGRELGFPTANLGANSLGFIPCDGVYASWVVIGSEKYPASVSIGLNPTFGDVTQRSVEAFLIDVQRDLYGKVIEVQFIERLRGMVAFSGREPLIDQMHADVAQCREMLTDD